jgi:uncharacterized protein YjbJ (UPF0337 family)
MGLQDKITGRLKQAAGDLTGNQGLREQGIREERKGQAKDELDRANAAADAKAQEVAALERQAARTKAANRSGTDGSATGRPGANRPAR